MLPGVLYGEGIKENLSLHVNEKEFEEVFKEAGESSLVELEVTGKKYQILIHQISKDPLSGRFLHIDFFKPSTKKKIEAEVPLVFEGESLAVKDLGGILETDLQQVYVKGLAHQLPREIVVNIEVLKTFEDKVVIGDLKVPEGVEILREKNEVVAHVSEARQEEKEEEKEEAAVVEGEEGEKEGEETAAEGNVEQGDKQKD